jgi:hypothetical protein
LLCRFTICLSLLRWNHLKNKYIGFLHFVSRFFFEKIHKLWSSCDTTLFELILFFSDMERVNVRYVMGYKIESIFSQLPCGRKLFLASLSETTTEIMSSGHKRSGTVMERMGGAEKKLKTDLKQERSANKRDDVGNDELYKLVEQELLRSQPTPALVTPTTAMATTTATTTTTTATVPPTHHADCERKLAKSKAAYKSLLGGFREESKGREALLLRVKRLDNELSLLRQDYNGLMNLLKESRERSFGLHERLLESEKRSTELREVLDTLQLRFDDPTPPSVDNNITSTNTTNNPLLDSSLPLQSETQQAKIRAVVHRILKGRLENRSTDKKVTTHVPQ